MIEIEGIEQLSRAVKNVAIQIGDKKTKRKVLRRAGNIVRDAARNIAPVGKKKSHFRYDTPKVSSNIRAPKGLGRKIAEYLRGNLAGAIQIINLRRTASIVIGPKVNKRGEGRGTYGPGTRKFDAYYAQMIFGSAKAFQRQVMAKALAKTRGQALASIETYVKKELEKAAKKVGLNVR